MQLRHKIILLLTIVAGLAQPGLAQERADGARLADACSSCHGANGAGGEAIPAIAGMATDDFVTLMRAFRDQTAPATIMNRLARGYTDEDLAALAAYFSELEAK